MVSNNIILSSALRGTLLSIGRTERVIDDITLRLASGLKINSALDKPSSFFAAKALQNTASDHARLLDGISQSVRTVQEAITGLEGVSKLVDQAETIVKSSKEYLESGETDPAVFEETVNSSPQALFRQINSARPDVYFRLNESGGPIIDSGVGTGGPVGANYNSGATPGAPALYTNNGTFSVNFDGINDRIQVNDSNLINLGTVTARTVELVFNANTTAGRQILYEEGAQVNGLTIYIDNGLLYFTAEDDNGANRYADLNVNVPIVAGQTYHAAFTLNFTTQRFTGYLDGIEVGFENLTGDVLFPAHSGDIGIGGMNGAAQFHDGESGGNNGFNFNGRISDVAIYNKVISEAVLLNHAESLNASTIQRFRNSEYENVLNQLDRLVVDAHYNGINLLFNDNLTTNFNSEHTSTLTTKGQNFSARGLGLSRFDFNDINDINLILEQLADAKTQIRNFSNTLVTDLSVINLRSDFTQQKINTHRSGADDLIVADQNQEGANLLATQTRLSLGITALSLAAQSQGSTLRLF